MKLTCYHTSKCLFFEFDLSKYSAGDYDTLIQENSKGAAYFCEKVIPYYPTDYIYKCEVELKNPILVTKDQVFEPEIPDGIIVKDDKFGNGAKYSEIVAFEKSKIRILSICEGRHFPKWHDDLGCEKWLENFDKIFDTNCITLN